MFSITAMQRHPSALHIWVMVLALLVSQALTVRHYHPFNHSNSHADAVLHAIDSNGLQYVLLAEKLKGQQEPYHHSHDESSCDLCYLANLPLFVSNMQFALATLQAYPAITDTLFILTIHTLRKDSLPRAPPAALFAV